MDSGEGWSRRKTAAVYRVGRKRLMQAYGALCAEVWERLRCTPKHLSGKRVAGNDFRFASFVGKVVLRTVAVGHLKRGVESAAFEAFEYRSGVEAEAGVLEGVLKA